MVTAQQLEYIKKYLPQDLWEIAGQFTIPVAFIQNMTELITLILNSKSIDTQEERQSWFDLLPVMNDEQINRLNDILTREKAKLLEIQQNYEEKKTEIKKKYLMKRQQMNQNMQTAAVKQQEQIQTAQDTEQADSLLTQI
ncbi:MAG TPA: hypothetical protein PLW93_04045 [Candidatus Absconditabacterales bacterium]|nr:hypothetical protein [Candidatus Absconditabacterales bacterium]HNG97414.1 hypothetical protein [Candidatus Absconditabacterales bacterium]